MKEIQTIDAEGHILCHDITRIIRDIAKDVAFPKGHVVTKEDIPVLLSLGKENLFVWEKEEGMLHENDAVQELYQICNNQYMYPSDIREGKIDFFAEKDGLFCVDVPRLNAVNSLGDIVIATRRSYSPVKVDDKLAGTRVVPLVIDEKHMQKAQEIAGKEPIFSLHPYQHKKFAIITTGSEVYHGRIEDTFTPVLRDKMSEFPSEEIGHVVLSDEHKEITQAIDGFIQQGAELVLCSGGMSVDPDDKTPLAIKNASDRVISYGAPVLPGAMFMLAYSKQGIPILGLPGCVMYSKRTIFDIILPRIMANIPIQAEDLYVLGNGGLCLQCKTCIYPNCAFGMGTN